jgi:uncharacterized repeat protein (TIGR03803 family)
MHGKAHSHASTCISWNPVSLVTMLVTLMFPLFLSWFLTLTATPAQGQSFHVIHSFSGQADGANPTSGVTMDAAGNLFGTTRDGGPYGYGTVFKLSHRGSNWILSRLHIFTADPDGEFPLGGITLGQDGSLFGTTEQGGYTYGSVFVLRPPARVQASVCYPWLETLIHMFYVQGDEGTNPHYGYLAFDHLGRLYGTTAYGGAHGGGTVYQLSPDGGGWTESVIFSFSLIDGYFPESGVVLDQSGNLYGTTIYGGDYSMGVVYELISSQGVWEWKTLYTFQGGDDGAKPFGGVIFGPEGNLYGTTSIGGTGGGGTVFELSPTSGPWNYMPIYSFNGSTGPQASLSMDAVGNLYGTTYRGGAYGWGSVFKLAPVDGSWTYSTLHDFTGGSDGGKPLSNVTVDPQGNLYGTTEANGPYGGGVVWEITPN